MMKWTAGRGMVILVALLAPAAASAAGPRPWTPVQADLSFGAQHYEDGRPETPNAVGFGSLYLGGAVPIDPWYRSFMGAGVEGTIDGSNGPYQWSIGAGPRMGLVWRLPHGPAGVFPDFYIYGRVTPFIGMRSVAGENYLQDGQEITKRGQGVRLGIGFTAPGWTATIWPAIFQGNMGHVHVPDDRAAIACCFAMIAALLINHSELTYEVYSEPGLPAIDRIGWRIGVGF